MSSSSFVGVSFDGAAAELFQLLLATDNLQDFLQKVAALAVSEIPTQGLSCGITTRTDGRAATVASSDEFARQLDELQYAHGTGPCLQAMDTGQVVLVTDAANETRWPAYRTDAFASGMRSSLSLPLLVGGGRGDTVGALNLYSTAPDTFTETQRRHGLEVAALAAGAIGVAIHIAEQAQLTEHLRTAMESRAVIDQAVGILVAQRRCSPDTAFDILRAASQRSNTKLRDIATRIVTSTASTG